MAGAESARMILQAGGRLGMGGDYGFAWNPHGTYAKELTFFVKHVGFTPLEVIRCATQTGAEIMGRGDEFGTLDAGKLADVLVVDGDVVGDISLLEDRRSFVAVMQAGVIKSGQASPGARSCARERKKEPHRRGAATLCGSWAPKRTIYWLPRHSGGGQWIVIVVVRVTSPRIAANLSAGLTAKRALANRAIDRHATQKLYINSSTRVVNDFCARRCKSCLPKDFGFDWRDV